MIPPSRVAQTGFMTAPAGISPWVTYLDRAMSSLRASATIAMRRIRPRSEPTRWRNQPLRALSLVSHPHPGKLDHCRAQTWIACLRDTLLVVDATTLPWAGSEACIGCQLPLVLEMPEQTLKVEHGSELRANALESHK